ncbi:MAG TPA: Phenylacetic acid catabolic protein, partial [Flavitalea sp.]|nr:Phenylacetic acid catabolic protein [Flavitalea sp.]
IRQQWDERVRLVLSEGTLPIPESSQRKRELGKEGHHTQHLYEILSEMQSLQRALPGCEW